MTSRKIRVGIDFDNTIICYDKLFARAVNEQGWDLGNLANNHSKIVIKEKLIELDGNDFRWQELQAIVYGILIKDADPYPGFLETLFYLKDLGDFQFYIVSHKTPHSHYLKHITLIDKALLWIKEKNLTALIPEENIFFRPTRDEKIAVINELNLDIFIDDLLEVLEDKNFPQIHKFYFSEKPHEYGLNHWEKIKETLSIFHHIGIHNSKFLQEIAPYPYSQVELLKRDGNNKIIKFADKKNKKFVLKKYSKVDNSYSTLENEYAAIKLLSEANLPVPKAFFKDSQLGFALYEHIHTAIETPSKADIILHFSQFLCQLHHLSEASPLEIFPPARDFREKICDYKGHVDRRIRQIKQGLKNDPRFVSIQDFLEKKLLPIYDIVIKRYQADLLKYRLNESNPIHKKQKILSPSDFGIHNAIYRENHSFAFIDFEYFGWDDPVKLTADFIHHAGQESISEEERLNILKQFAKNSPLDEEFFKRLSLLLDLVGLEWILIILNIANPEVLERRMYANPGLNVEQLIEERLQKAQKRADLFHTNINLNNVFLSLKSIHTKVAEKEPWQQLIM